MPSSQQRLASLHRRYRRLATELAEIGFILKGSVVERYLPCGKSQCRCHADPPQLHGPYWQWSTAIGGKTVSRNLTEGQARLYLEWIGNRKRLEAILAQMNEVAQEAADLLATESSSPPNSRTRPHPSATR